jgi:hypothetical protein
MITPTQNIPINIEVAILGNTGKFETGLSVDYEVRKVSDDSVLTSGTATEASGVYYFTYTFTVVEEYRLQWITPIGYEDGLENIVVEAPVSGITASDVWDYLTTGVIVSDSVLEWILDRLDSVATQQELSKYDTSKGTTIKAEIQASIDTIIKEINKSTTPKVKQLTPRKTYYGNPL